MAYDALQTIFDVELPTAEVLFGTEGDAVTFQEDIILHKCYRNPLEVLVTAHAIGFGLYGRIVQMLESVEHWEDYGYSIVSGELRSGQRIVVRRPSSNSPSAISQSNPVDEIVRFRVFDAFEDEVQHVVDEVAADIQNDGVRPEDVLVICADDKSTPNYFRSLSSRCLARGIKTNNLQDQQYSLRPFVRKDAVTLSTIYKAKGNEAYVVYVLGCDALFAQPSATQRNKAFTAMTRAKGWLRMSGIGDAARRMQVEVDKAKERLPNLEFTYPPPGQLLMMKRDMSVPAVDVADAALDQLEDELPIEELQALLRRRLQQLSHRAAQGRPSKKRRSPKDEGGE